MLNPDGTPYRASGSLQMYKTDRPELALLNLWDEAAIKAGGSPIEYYKVFINPGTLDRLYREDRGKVFSPIATVLWAMYEPVTATQFQAEFGIDSPADVIFEMNYAAVLRDLGHVPTVGSRIRTPHRGENWEIVHTGMSEFQLWGATRLRVVCTKFQESVTTGEGRVTSQKPSYGL